MGSFKSHNILYSSLSGQMVGGGQRSLLLLLARLERRKYRPFLICPSQGSLIDEARNLGVETTIIPTPGLKTLSFSTLLKLIKFIRARDIDLIHTDSPRQTIYLGMAAKLARKPLVWHVRVGDPEHRLYDRFLFSLANRVIAVSKAAGERFLKVPGRTDKMTIIYNGVDLEEFSPRVRGEDIRREFDIGGHILIGTVGQMLPRKGQEIFLEAASELSKELTVRVKFMIVGETEGEYAEELRNKARRLSIEEDVIFTGFRTDTPRIMAAMDIFVLASTYLEGLSRVIIEAMATGKPVVATNLGGNPEAVTDGLTGRLVPPNDPRRLAEAMGELVKDKDKRVRMGAAARKRTEELFDIAENVKRTEKIYEELLCPAL